MNAVSVYNVSKTLKDEALFSNVSFGLDIGERIGLVGRNGAGKSTFLKIIAGILEPDSGEVTINNSCRVAYLEQDVHFPEGCTLEQFVLLGDDPHVKLLREFQEGNHDVFDKIESLGLWSVQDRYRSYLGELNVQEPMDKMMAQLSGGTQKKAAIARIMAIEPNILLLDEPTNHLDIPAIEWLETKLGSTSSGYGAGGFTVVLVTHDRYFLDRICTRTMEIDGHKAYFYDGGYTQFTEHKAERLNAMQKEQDRLATILRREVEWLHRGPKARTGKDSGRKQRIEEMRSQQTRKEEDQREFSSMTRRMGKKILELKDASAMRGGRTIVKDLSIEFTKGMRIGVIGANGSGKSTLLDLITGRIAPSEGEVDTGLNTAFGYYDQKASALPLGSTMLEYIEEIGQNITLSDGYSVTPARFLELFGFPSSFHRLPIGVLSGGEKRRLYLIATIVRNPNFLVLDEPTNDLDIDTLCRLEQYILDFQGCVVCVSHDRAFLDKVCNELIVMPNAIRFEGGYSDYRRYEDEKEEEKKADQRNQRNNGPKSAAPQKKQDNSPKTGTNTEAPNPNKAKRKLTFKEQRELEGLPALIEELEERKTQLEEFFSSGKLDTTGESTKEYESTLQQLETLYARWEELESLSNAH